MSDELDESLEGLLSEATTESSLGEDSQEQVQAGSEETYESLDAVAYQNLKEKFESLGVGGAWKQGVRKADMIKDALEKLKLVQSLSDAGLEGEDLDKEVEEKSKLAEQAKIDDEADKAAQAILDKEKADQGALQEVESQEISVEVLEQNLGRVNLSLKRCIKTHRSILLAKKAQLESLLSRTTAE